MKNTTCARITYVVRMDREKKELKDFLCKQIAYSGFPLEIEVSSSLEKEKWIALNNQPFRDHDTGELRSVDILAFHEPTVFGRPKEIPFGFSPRLIIECKKSSSHGWVFFTRPQIKAFPMDGQVYDFPRAFSTSAYKEKDSLSQIGPFSYEYYFNGFPERLKEPRKIHYADFERTAITYEEYKISKIENEGLKRSRNSEKREIFEAINQLVKYQHFDVVESVSAPSRIRGAASPFFPIEFSFLAIVFDGKLFEAIVGQGELALEERNHLLLHYIYRPRDSFANLNFWIDVVKKDFFSEYLARIYSDILMITDKIVSENSLLSIYLKKD